MENASTNTAWIEKPDGSRAPLAGNCGLGRSESNALVIAGKEV